MRLCAFGRDLIERGVQRAKQGERMLVDLGCSAHVWVRTSYLEGICLHLILVLQHATAYL